MNLFRGYVYCVASSVPLALLSTAAGYGLSGPIDLTIAELVGAVVTTFLVALVLTSLAGLLFGLPLVAGLSYAGFANSFSIMLAGALGGFVIYYAWLVAPAAGDPQVGESTRSIIAETRPEMIGFVLSGTFAAAAFWIGATR